MRGSASSLKGAQQLLFIFVDDEGAEGWTIIGREFVEKHVISALHWLEQQASRCGVEARFTCAFAPGTPAVAQKVNLTILNEDYTAGPHHSHWQNCAVAGLTHSKSGSVASLWNDVFLRHGLEESNVEGRLALFGVRRYCPSVAFQYAEGQNQEFEKERGIIYDLGITENGQTGQRYLDSQIAHEILHLYGAVDLTSNKFPMGPEVFMDDFSPNLVTNEIMGIPTQQPIKNYVVSDLTAYLVGWQSEKPVWLFRSSVV